YQEFVRDPDARARYWSRSAIGWRRVAEAEPNPAHRALAALEAADRLPGVITQNVDGLHARAGSRRVVELHGSLAGVKCLACGESESRDVMQRRLLSMNPDWASFVRTGADGGTDAGDGRTNVPEMPATPDGDAAVPERLSRGFRVPGCRSCGGVLKPDVVFFGENVPPPVVEAAWALYEEAGAMLVVGSSLTVYSGRRFTDRAARDRRPVAIVNLGPTRADESAAVRIEGRVGEVLPRLARRLGVEPPSTSPPGGNEFSRFGS
ncbi:MAG: Sir2 family NAD-dependent protein deacetylase, partial [Gemmatimonadota bacterium]